MRNPLKTIYEGLFPSKKMVIAPESETGNIDMSNSEFANVINKPTTNTYIYNYNNQEQFESAINSDSSTEIRELIIPIEELIHEGKFALAITKYEEIIASPAYNGFSKDDRFSVLIGMFNCHINKGSSESDISFWSNKIKALSDEVKEIYRYYYLLAIIELGKDSNEVALIYMQQSLKAKADYVNAITGEIHVKCNLGMMTYEEATKSLNVLIENYPNAKDLSTIHANYGDIAYKAKDYNNAKIHYEMSNKIKPSLSKQIGIAICQYTLSFEEMSEDGRVELNKIDFELFNKAESSFNAIYSQRNEDNIETIIKLSFSFYLSILALNGRRKQILEIYEENKQYSQLFTSDSINFIVESQLLNDIKDEELFNRLDEYYQIKYESLYLEKNSNYQGVVELLTPILESKYKDEKMFRLTFLIALKELNRYSDFMEHYQRFLGHQDEVMRMTYIEMLMKQEDTTKAYGEIVELSKIAKNGFILYELMWLFINNNMNKELRLFFDDVRSGKHKIIGQHKSRVFNQMMQFYAINKDYDEYFKVYEETDLSFLDDMHHKIIDINYHLFKNDLEKLASAYYEYFLVSNDYESLMKAVQVLIQINGLYKAEHYLSMVQPMELKDPEYYYMFRAIILREKNNINDAFKELDFVLENIQLDIESPFHQFYTSFNMNNNRTDIAFKYMGDYYSKNPNPKWFKMIQHSEDDSGEVLLAKLEEAIGGKRDLSQINKYYYDGLIGVSVYNKMVGNGMEDILLMNHYPFTKKPISKGNIQEAKEKVEFIGNNVIVDTTTLLVLSSVNSLELLNIFNEIIIPMSTIVHLNEIKTGVFTHNANTVLNFIGKSPKIKKLAVDELMRVKNKQDELIHDDTFDCVILSRTLNTTFLNTEIFVSHQYDSLEIIDINVFMMYLKESHPEVRNEIAFCIASMRKNGYDFLSFDSEDIQILYKEQGLEGINPFLIMGRNADYKTFTSAYNQFLKSILDEKSFEEFEICSSKIIRFMDTYLGKTRHYIYSLIRQFPEIEELMGDIVTKPSATKILTKKAMIELALANKEAKLSLRTFEFYKLLEIASSFMVFGIQFISIAKKSEVLKNKCLEILKSNLVFNDDNDVAELMLYMSRTFEEQKRQS